MNIIARLEYERAYYDSAVHRFNYYTTTTPQNFKYLKRPCIKNSRKFSWIFYEEWKKTSVNLTNIGSELFGLLRFIWFAKWLQIGCILAQSAGVVEYTACIYAEGLDCPNDCPRYDTKPSDGEVTVKLEVWGMRSTPSLLLLQCPLWSGVVAPDRVPSMGQIELFDI